eukprot:m.31217 g.31217  ORF g.31217 m.31217 type:complete len:184 (-) comp9297_c0_seq1:419-970(-)
MAVALGLVGGAAVASAAAVYNAKKEVNAVLDNKVQKKIDKKCAEFDKKEEKVFAELAQGRAEELEERKERMQLLRDKHGLEGARADRTNGYLLKRGKLNTAFKKRWFVLEGREIKYSKEPGSSELGTISLGGAQVTLTSENDEFQLNIETLSGRTYVLRGEPPNPRSRLENWVQAIEAALGLW